MASNKLSKFSHYWILGVFIAVSAISAIVYVGVFVSPGAKQTPAHGDDPTARYDDDGDSAMARQYAYHNALATRFWVGEAADESNAFITNHESAWVGDWVSEFGGVDNPDNRCGYKPCGFTPKQNAFYVALPFNDIDASGKPKSVDTLKHIPWYSTPHPAGESVMKNRWVEVKFGDKVAYGQVEDVGPMHEDDIDYVFGVTPPKYKIGLDLSPALTDYLGTDGLASVEWRFVEEVSVPVGPWREIVTRSQINY